MKRSALLFFVLLVIFSTNITTWGKEFSKKRIDSNASPFNSTTGGAVLTFPEDHRFHNQSIMKNKYYQEWLYWTGFPINPDTNEQIAFMVNIFRTFSDGEFKHRLALSVFQTNKNGPQFKSAVNIPVDIKASCGRTEDNKDNFFEYKGNGLSITYLSGVNTWHIVADNGKKGSEHVTIDLKFTPTDMGYVAESPTGITYQGVPSYRTAPYNQSNLRSLSYYYSAPRCSEVGKITIGSKTIEVNDTSGWFDHQWGGFSQGSHAYNYNWLGARLHNGDCFMLRDWHNPVRHSVSAYGRLAYFPKDGNPQYWQGSDAFAMTEVDYYVDKKSGRTWGLKYKLTTPIGNFFIEPIFYADQFPYKYWEGGMWIRKLNVDGTAGDIIGKTFLEQSQTYR